MFLFYLDLVIIIFLYSIGPRFTCNVMGPISKPLVAKASPEILGIIWSVLIFIKSSMCFS